MRAVKGSSPQSHGTHDCHTPIPSKAVSHNWTQMSNRDRKNYSPSSIVSGGQALQREAHNTNKP